MTFPLRRIFLHFFDPHFMGRRRDGSITPQEHAEASLATRLALLCAEQVYLPAASYIENSSCREVINEYADIFDDGSIQLVGGEDTFEMYAQSKLLQYDPGSPRHLAYESAVALGLEAPSFASRRRNTTGDLHDAWKETASQAELLIHGLPVGDTKGFVRRWEEVSDALGSRAFIPEYVMPLLNLPEDTQGLPIVESRVRSVINHGYFNSFLREYGAGVVSNMVHLAGFSPEPDVPVLPYMEVRRALARTGWLERVGMAPALELRTLHEVEDVARQLIPLVQVDESALPSARLTLPIANLQPDLASLVKVRPGKKAAHIYARRVQTLFEALFRFSLGDGIPEAPINDGRKRIDILFPNTARSGAFDWARRQYAARFVIVECKNYTEDPANPEYDQLAMRFNDSRGSFGILACRKLKNLDLAIERCRDVHRDHRRLMVPLTDDDLQLLINTGVDPGFSPLGDSLVGERMLRVATA